MSWQSEVFKGKIGFTMEDSTPHWNLPPRPAAGSPNVLMIVLDDVGYAHLGCYGSPIETPNIDALGRARPPLLELARDRAVLTHPLVPVDRSQ